METIDRYSGEFDETTLAERIAALCAADQARPGYAEHNRLLDVIAELVRDEVQWELWRQSGFILEFTGMADADREARVDRINANLTLLRALVAEIVEGRVVQLSLLTP